MKPDAEVIEAFRIAEQEMQDDWKARQAAVANGHPGSHWCDPNLLLAAHWLIVFAPARVKIVVDGLPIGNVLDILKKERRGCVFPPVVEQVWQEWNEKIEAARIEREPEWKKRAKRKQHRARAPVAKPK